jgi:hypothetical protein
MGCNQKHQMPQKPGYYWAKWRIAADDTHEGDELTPSDSWEIVQVNWNVSGWEDETDEENPERLSVLVPGVREVQWRDCFVWGDFIASLKPEAGVHSSEAMAWASSKPYRKNHLMTASQYNSAPARKRIDFDIPLFASGKAGE